MKFGVSCDVFSDQSDQRDQYEKCREFGYDCAEAKFLETATVSWETIVCLREWAAE